MSDEIQEGNKVVAFANQPKEFGFNFKGKEEHQTVLVKEVL